MLEEAIQVIRKLFSGETVTFRGHHIETENARLWDCPSAPPPIGVAVSGPESCTIAGRYADAMIAVQPDAELGEQFGAEGGAGKPRIGQAAVAFDPDPAAATERAREQFRWFVGGWNVMAELPSPKSFDAASRTVREEDVSAQVPCGPDVGRHVDTVARFVEAGFTHVALVQVGADAQDPFFAFAEQELLPALREL